MKIFTANGKLTVKKLRGDRVRFKDYEHADPYREAYPKLDRDRVFTILGREEWEGTNIRLRVDAEPFYVWPRDVKLAWNTPKDRTEALLAAGHTR